MYMYDRKLIFLILFYFYNYKEEDVLFLNKFDEV